MADWLAGEKDTMSTSSSPNCVATDEKDRVLIEKTAESTWSVPTDEVSKPYPPRRREVNWLLVYELLELAVRILKPEVPSLVAVTPAPATIVDHVSSTSSRRTFPSTGAVPEPALGYAV